MAELQQFTGCFLGLALGDALGAPYEGGIPERIVWQLIGRTLAGKKRYTDDTQMSLDIADSLCDNNGINQDHLAATFASSYRWSRGYGAGAAQLLKKIKKGAHWQQVNCSRNPEGSYGNGAAMRAPVAALYFQGNRGEIVQAVQKISEITHAHPLAIEGAQIIALATSAALERMSFKDFFNLVEQQATLKEYRNKLQVARRWLEGRQDVAATLVVQKLGNSMAAVDSCITALYTAIRYLRSPFADMMEFIQQCSGDTDTIGAMAGAVWGAYNGRSSLNPSVLATLESASRIEQRAEQLYRRHQMV